MPPGGFATELKRVGRMICSWRAQIATAIGISITFAILWMFSLSDIYLQYGRIGRFFIWIILVALIVATFKYSGKLMTKKHSVMGVAAMVELAFPELDNHLINYLQFSADKSKNPFKKAYVKRGVPEWSKIKLTDMKNRKAHMRANIALAIAIAMFAIPLTFTGKAWGVAVWRMINPFGNIRPISLTNIIEVDPGDTVAIQGEPLIISVKVTGKSGHKVSLDLDPADNEKTTYAIGNIQGKGEEDFSYRIPKVTTDMRYRFRAGDSPSPEWYEIKSRAPLAMNSVGITVQPPAYTKGDTQTFKGLSDEVFIPQGSDVTVSIECNAALKSATVGINGKNPVKLAKGANAQTWTGKINVTSGSNLKFIAIDEYDDELVNAVNYTMQEDRAPVIDILAPRGRIMLAPKTAPIIEFAALDDYGIANIVIEKIAAGSSKKSKGQVVQTWKVNSEKDFAKVWEGEIQNARTTKMLSYRITVTDNCPYEQHSTKSPSIIFNAITVAKAESTKDKLRNKADAALSKLINMQKDNITQTKNYQSALKITSAAQWEELSQTQAEIRALTKTILSNPLRPLGGLTDRVKKIYLNEMSLVIGELAMIPKTPEGEKANAVTSALNKEEYILRSLTFADNSASQNQTKQKSTMLQGLLDSIIKGEQDVIKKTESSGKTGIRVADMVIDKQDELALDLTDFVNACRAEVRLIAQNSPPMAEAFTAAADACGNLNIRGDMLLASDKLDSNKPNPALEHENAALKKLHDISKALAKTEATEEEEKIEEMLDVIEDLGGKLQKIKNLQSKALEAMVAIKANKNLDIKELDILEQEYDDLIKQSKDVMLQVPTDLHIFTELNALSDMIEEVISVFQEVDMSVSEEKNKTKQNVHEEAYSKEESLDMIEMMEEASERIDDLEGWLTEAAETTKVTQEAMDMEESPPEGISMGPLEAAAMDMVGDLVDKDQNEETKEEAEDSATNKSQSDVEAGGPTLEGDITSFAAKGKSGNTEPDHKEQDGRGNVGRQGMSNGETAAASGTIGEGDSDIEARRTQEPTQSGQVDADGGETVASGGGKAGTGKADGVGDGLGGTQRMDSDMAGGGAEGMAALEKKLDRMYEQASAKDIKAPSIRQAAHHVRQAQDAIAQARPIEQIKEHKKLAAAAIKKAATELHNGANQSIDTQGESSILDDVVESTASDAPSQYRDLVNEYYKNLNDDI